MNTLPILALAIVASGYAVAIEETERQFDAMPVPELTAYAASNSSELSVYDVLAHGAQPADEPHCGAHISIVETLAHDFAESAVERRILADGMRVSLWASEIMGTWTMVHAGDDGISCIIASGTGWTSDRPSDEVFAQVALTN